MDERVHFLWPLALLGSTGKHRQSTDPSEGLKPLEFHRFETDSPRTAPATVPTLSDQKAGQTDTVTHCHINTTGSSQWHRASANPHGCRLSQNQLSTRPSHAMMRHQRAARLAKLARQLTCSVNSFLTAVIYSLMLYRRATRYRRNRHTVLLCVCSTARPWGPFRNQKAYDQRASNTRAATATVGNVDQALCEYIDNLFLGGASTSEAPRALYGLRFMRRLKTSVLSVWWPAPPSPVIYIQIMRAIQRLWQILALRQVLWPA